MTKEFVAAMRESHVVVTEIDLYFPGSATPVKLTVEGGDLTMDATASIRRSGTVSIPWSLEAGFDLGIDLRSLPLGGWVSLRRGIRYGSGKTELVPLGPYRVEAVTWKTVEGTASIEIADRMAQVRDEPFLSPYSPAAGQEIVRTGTLTQGSAAVTGLSQTSDLLVGMSVRGAGVPSGAVIQTINSSSQVTLNVAANMTQTAVTDSMGAAGTVQNLIVIGTTATLSVGMQCDFGLNVYGEALNAPGVTSILSVDSIDQITLDQPTAPAVTFWGTGQIPGRCSTVFTVATVTKPLTFGGGKRIAAAAIDIVTAVFGTSIPYRKLHDPAVITSDVYLSENRADALGALAVAASGEAYFDWSGAFVFGPERDPAAAPVWTVNVGDHGVLLDADESLDRTGTYNGVLVEGQGAADAAPVSALVKDENPSSPTRWGGPFGKVARIERLTSVETQAQATTAATTLLNRGLRLSRSVTLTAAPNPALEPNDVIRIVFPDGREELHFIDAIRLDLGPAGAQTLETRSVDADTTRQLAAPTSRGRYNGAAAVWHQAARERDETPA